MFSYEKIKNSANMCISFCGELLHHIPIPTDLVSDLYSSKAFYLNNYKIHNSHMIPSRLVSKNTNIIRYVLSGVFSSNKGTFK